MPEKKKKNWAFEGEKFTGHRSSHMQRRRREDRFRVKQAHSYCLVRFIPLKIICPHTSNVCVWADKRRKEGIALAAIYHILQPLS